MGDDIFLIGSPRHHVDGSHHKQNILENIMKMIEERSMFDHFWGGVWGEGGWYFFNRLTLPTLNPLAVDIENHANP